jgi:hypothetical protein
MGRGFDDAGCAAPEGAPVAVLSLRGWTTWFGQDPGIVGRGLHINGQLVTVVGVAAADAVGEPLMPSLLIPLSMQPLMQGPDDYVRDVAGRHAWLDLAGRLRPGRTIAEAQAELAAIARTVDAAHPGRVTRFLVTDGLEGCANVQGRRCSSLSNWSEQVCVYPMQNREVLRRNAAKQRIVCGIERLDLFGL